ncbi:hypothetical protein PsorP6_016266 [Peronosclerospora sorghi]|uniref:Uncharacterized protein n=1 Tax=Peronosclerospora sorghi TaxID=230839 RepID=A0ACC0VJI1_9STRA|nr:hypothetical protein PsorP6_016266 [Peronosclerospora sorghi]
MPLSQRWRHRVLQTMLLGSLLYMICTLGWISSRRTPSPEQIQAEAHARTVRNLPRGDVQRRNLTCIGWRATADCTPDGPRQVAQDLPCHAIVPSGTSGYCEVQDVDTSERFRVMRRTCSRYKDSSVFQCSDAPDFVQYRIDTLEAQGLNRLPSAAEVAVELQRMEKTRPDILETPREPDGMPDRIIWTHLLTFGKNRLCSEYRIEPFIAPPDFPRAQRCYGERDLARNVCFHVQLFADLPFAGLETHVRRFAFEAAQRSRGEHLVVTK